MRIPARKRIISKPINTTDVLSGSIKEKPNDPHLARLLDAVRRLPLNQEKENELYTKTH